MSATEVMQQFRALPKPDQRQVAEQIWDELDDAAFEETPVFRAELRRRLADVKTNPADSVSWEEVRAEARRRLDVK